MTRKPTHLTSKRREVQRLGEQFAAGEIDKWDFYTALHCLHQPYAILAELTGISEDVVRMRFRDLRAMSYRTSSLRYRPPFQKFLGPRKS